jgi:hypothetical protein
MKALPLIALFALAAGSSAAGDAAPLGPLVVEDLTWRMAADGPPRSVEIRTGDSRSNVSVEVARFSSAAGLEGDGPVRFTLNREAGRTDCSGARKGRTAKGTCRFVSAPAFEQGLAERGVHLGPRTNLVALALVDARVALVDDLSREGLPVADTGQLIAASALKVTGDYVHELKAAGLQLDKLGDAFACRALDVDGAFLSRMALAGYPRLSVNQAITMKAVGVTPEYAAAMNRAVGAVNAVDQIGDLQ